ncbi:MAG: tripartite tricarboxylate transporter substrate binding protein [Xanthobacteraceae bacterium]|nr:tripartite tricarboxylate transporter substrate binding protein [Xanthobacteraceae bacterium]
MAHRWLIAGAMLLASACGASAQSWPSKPLRIIVPVTAGSATDVAARVIAEHLSTQLGQTVVVENRTGAGGTTGMGYVAKQVEPDGYTILVHSAAFAIQPATFPNLGYDAGKDFSGVTLVGHAPLVMIASPAKYKTLKQLVDAAKAKPNSVNYSSVGYGAAAHLAAERLRLAAGFEAQQIPFRGAPEAVNEVLGQRVDFFFSPTLAAVPLIRDGKLSALAVSGSKRALSLPEVPTTIEAGYPNSDYNFWIGMWVPVKTPRHVVDKLYQETRKILDIPSLQEKLTALGSEPARMTPAEFDKFFQDDIALNHELVKAAGIKPNP